MASPKKNQNNDEKKRTQPHASHASMSASCLPAVQGGRRRQRLGGLKKISLGCSPLPAFVNNTVGIVVGGKSDKLGVQVLENGRTLTSLSIATPRVGKQSQSSPCVFSPSESYVGKAGGKRPTERCQV
jgi:hypothetical protein